MQPVSRRPWCSGTIKRVCPQVDPQARSYNGSVRISAAGSGSVDPTCVVQLNTHPAGAGVRISAERRMLETAECVFQLNGAHPELHGGLRNA